MNFIGMQVRRRLGIMKMMVPKPQAVRISVYW